MKKISLLLIMTAIAAAAMATTQDDIALYRGAGTWLAHYSAGGTMNDPDGAGGTPASIDTTISGFGFAVPTAKPMLGDVTGDGIDDIVVAQVSGASFQWVAGHSVGTGGVGAFSTATASSGFLGASATSIDNFLGDVTGDGIDDMVAVDANYMWHVRPATTAGLSNVATSDQTKQFGLTASDVSIFGDFNGDGMHDVGIWRNSVQTYISLTGGTVGSGVVGTGATLIGSAGSTAWDIPLIGDVNGDGRDDLVLVDTAANFQWVAVYAQPSGQLNYATGHSGIVSFGATASNDVPFLADINGDGKADIGVYRDGQWLVAFTDASGDLTSSVSDGANLGLASDTPLIGQLHTLPGPPTIGSFAASDYYIDPGTSVTLSWETDDTIVLEIDMGVGDVASISTDGDGNTNVSPTITTTYTLTASNGTGAATAVLTVNTGPARPNIVLFVADDYGLQDTSVPFILTNGVPASYNFNSYYYTPELESLAADGMRFTTAYAQTVCSPTRCGLMTGRNSARHAVSAWIGSGAPGTGGSPVNWRYEGLDATDMTLPLQLQSAGYRTIHVGKWHIAERYTYGENPLNLGFDVNIAGDRRGAPKSLDILTDKGYINYSGYHGMPGLEAYDGTDFLTGVLAIEANKQLEDAVDRGSPFFLYMSFYAVHAPFTDPNPDATLDYSTGAVSTLHENFATMVEGMDLAIGEIRQKLVALGVAEDTLIVFLGDNGSDSPAVNIDDLPVAPYNDFPMRGKKGSKWEGGTRVPMVACWAALNPANDFQTAIPIPTNSIETDIVTSWDVPATLLDAAGLSPTNNFGEDAYSLVPYLAGTPGSHRPQEVVIHYPHDHRSDFFSWIRQGDMKLIYNYQNNTHQLYNLATDPTESNDLASVQTNTLTQMARALAQKLDGTWGDAGPLKPIIATTAPPGNIISIPDDPAVDVDSDGIADNTEDPNLNGLVDPGETDPDNDNTDGDGTPDGAELRTGTDPLNPADDFVGAWVSDGGSGFTATWPSAPGAFYEIQTTSNLTEWLEVPIVTGIPATDPGTNTSYTIPASSDVHRFYRIGLLP